MIRGRRHIENGFTLIELIIVLAIIGVILALVAPRLIDQFDKSKSVAAQAQLRSIESALASLRIDVGRYPTNAEGLALLIQPSAELADSWQGPYLASDLPQDPWGKPYVYRQAADGLGRPVIGTLGSDGKAGGTGAAKDIFIGEPDAVRLP
jgi:general secretion pathway protein G